MSDTFEKILVKDDRLGCITPKVKFQVFKGGQNITCQPYKAISQTTANHVYNVTVPSLETIISREVLWKSIVTLKISNPDKVNNEFAIKLRRHRRPCPFPTAQLSQCHDCDDKQQYSIPEHARDAPDPTAPGGSRGVR